MLMAASIDIPQVTENGMEKWRVFLTADAEKNGGTAQTLLRLGPEGRPVKLLCCSQVSIVIFLTDLEFEIEKATFFSV
jgi:hypothetical protein